MLPRTRPHICPFLHAGSTLQETRNAGTGPRTSYLWGQNTNTSPRVMAWNRKPSIGGAQRTSEPSSRVKRAGRGLALDSSSTWFSPIHVSLAWYLVREGKSETTPLGKQSVFDSACLFGGLMPPPLRPRDG